MKVYILHSPSPDNEEYMNKEKEQEEKIKKINEKINDLEKHQNRMTEFNLDKYKSIKSLVMVKH